MADVLDRMQDVLSAPNAPGPPRAFDPTDPAAALDPTERPAAMTPTQRYGMTASGVMTRRGGARPAPPTRALAPAAPATPAWSPYSYTPVAPTTQPAGPQPYSLGKGYNVVPPSQPGGSWLLADPRGRVTAHATQSLAEASVPPSVARSMTPTSLTGAAAGVGGAVAGAVLASNPAQAMMGGEQGAANVNSSEVPAWMKSIAPPTTGPGQPVGVAQAQEQKGADAQTIFQSTGWYHDADGKWKWVLPDRDASLNRDAFLTYRQGSSEGQTQQEFEATHPEKVNLAPGMVGAKLPQVLNHSELYNVYPKLRDATVERMPSGTGNLADYNEETNTIRIADGQSPEALTSTLLHELQHGVQGIEGFGRGGPPALFYPADFRDKVVAANRAFTVAAQAVTNAGGDPSVVLQSVSNNKKVEGLPPAVVDQMAQALNASKEINQIQHDAYNNYRRISGERESFAVENERATGNYDQLPTQIPGFPSPSEQLIRTDPYSWAAPTASGQTYPQVVPPAPAGTPMQLTPVEHDPYAPAVVTPVEHDPFPQPAVTLTTVDHDPYVGTDVPSWDRPLPDYTGAMAAPSAMVPTTPPATALDNTTWSTGNQAPAPDLATWQTPPVNTVSPGYYGY